jgi:hypothetical protein
MPTTTAQRSHARLTTSAQEPNMAEIECAVVSTQCLDRRLEDRETVGREIAAWQTRRNAAKATVDWRFTTAKARRKLNHIYPL